MPFITARLYVLYGLPMHDLATNRYCVDNVSTDDPNWGKCYSDPAWGKAIYIYSGPETPRCQIEGTCIRENTTSTSKVLATIFDHPGKQGILSFFSIRAHSTIAEFDDFVANIRPAGLPLPSVDQTPYPWGYPQYILRSATLPHYDPVTNIYFDINPYNITRGNVYIIRWNGSIFNNKLLLVLFGPACNNCWTISSGSIIWYQEASPLAIIKLKYEEWLAHKELRKNFGYSATGIHQSGWSAQDMIRALKEVYPDRSWAVYDDRENTLYIYNLDFDDVPEGLFDLLSVASVVVLKPKTDADAALRWVRDISSYLEQNYGGQEEG